MTLIVDLPLLALGVVGSCEIVLRSPISHHFSRLTRSVGQASLRLTSAQVSDHWKAIVARRYAVDVLSSTLFIFGVLVAALLPTIAALCLVSESLGAALGLLSRPDVSIILTVVAVGYFSFRTRMCPRE